MKKYNIFVIISLLVFLALTYWSCTQKDDDDNNGNGDPYTVTITQPTEYSTVTGDLTVRAEADPIPNMMQFVFDTFTSVIDSTDPFSATFNISGYSQGTYIATVVAYWADTIDIAEVTFTIGGGSVCDPSIPVVLNGDTIPEANIVRDGDGCVTQVKLSNYYLIGPDCLSGIEDFPTVEYVLISNNALTSLDLTPLTSCPNLITLGIYYNTLNSINFSPLANCTELETLWVSDVPITSIDLSFLTSCPDFRYLLVSHTALTSIDLAPLGSHQDFNQAYISYNQLTGINLSPLASCPNLDYFVANHNLLTSIDLSPLSSCTNLERLYFEHNQLTAADLTPLSNCTHLIGLDLKENEISTIDLLPLWDLVSLEFINLNSNYFDETTCDHVCNFIDDHPDCLVNTDCHCD
ncbi:hypothetical protein JXI42_07040 [bacterium]|nr:hypothetical protein [bacterium]